jgi:hypothetical protein
VGMVWEAGDSSNGAVYVSGWGTTLTFIKQTQHINCTLLHSPFFPLQRH